MPKNKKMCSGCHQEYYNSHAKDGCWMYGTAKIVTRMRVGTWDRPPYKWKPEKVLSCYQPDGAVMLTLDDFRTED